MACTLSNEAMRHAKVHGDGRTLRDLALTRAKIAMEDAKRESNTWLWVKNRSPQNGTLVSGNLH